MAVASGLYRRRREGLIVIGLHSFGTDLRSCELNGIRVSETLMPPGLSLDAHRHQAAQICFVLEGTYAETTRDGKQVLRPGLVQLHDPGEWHTNHFGEEGALAILISVAASRWRHMRRRPLPASTLLASIADEIRRELIMADEASNLAVEGLSLLMLSHLSRETTGQPPEPAWLAEAVRIIEREYAMPLSLSSIAARVGVHRATLAAAFRRFRSVSAGECIREVRLRRATQSLLATGVPVAEIAFANGFSDQAHFIRAFRAANGISPGAFRRMWRR